MRTFAKMTAANFNANDDNWTIAQVLNSLIYITNIPFPK